MTDKNPKHDPTPPKEPEELTDEEAQAISGGDGGSQPSAPMDPWEYTHPN